MSAIENKHRILILGASGFLGNAIYKELCTYFRTFGTYKTPKNTFEQNKHFFHYDMEEDDIFEILGIIRPSIIISALRGNFNSQVIVHSHLTEYMQLQPSRLLFLSSANVFDSYSKYPSYENDKTLSDSVYGHFKIKIENMLMRLPKNQFAIIRLPMVFGNLSPRITEIKEFIKNKEAIEVFPNLIMNVATDTRVTQQIHYIINKNNTGIFHLGSTDLVHHDEFITDILKKLDATNALLKNVYTTNNDRYLAVLPKYNLLPKHLQFTSKDFISEIEV